MSDQTLGLFIFFCFVLSIIVPLAAMLPLPKKIFRIGGRKVLIVADFESAGKNSWECDVKTTAHGFFVDMNGPARLEPDGSMTGKGANWKWYPVSGWSREELKQLPIDVAGKVIET